MSIAIVTDSTADIPAELLEKYHIRVVPNMVIIGNTSLVDGQDITRQEFYQRLPDMDPHPTTSTASVGAYQQIYEELFEQGASQIISIHASSLLSGIFNAASTAAQVFDERVLVLDGEQLTLGLGYQVLAAAEAIAQGTHPAAVIEIIEDVRRRVRVIAMLDTLEYVRRSGRVSWARARIGNLLRIKPFVEVKSGKVLSLGEARTRRKGIDRLKNYLFNLGPLERLAILHTNAESDAHQILADIKPNLPTEPLVVNVTTVIGAHVGPNSLGFAAVIK